MDVSYEEAKEAIKKGVNIALKTSQSKYIIDEIELSERTCFFPTCTVYFSDDQYFSIPRMNKNYELWLFEAAAIKHALKFITEKHYEETRRNVN